jgi:hypothetical protein
VTLLLQNDELEALYRNISLLALKMITLMWFEVVDKVRKVNFKDQACGLF